MKNIIIFLFLCSFSTPCICKTLTEEEFYSIFENYYFPSQIYFNIDEEKELDFKILKILMETPIEIKDLKIIEKKGKIKVPKHSTFYLRVCYLENLIAEDGLITRWSEKKRKYILIPDNSWNLFKKTSGLPYPFYLNCYFNIPNYMEKEKIKGKKFIKFEKNKNFCKGEFCYAVSFNFYLKNYDIKIEDKDKIIFNILNIKEKAPFSNKRIWEIYGEVKIEESIKNKDMF